MCYQGVGKNEELLRAANDTIKSTNGGKTYIREMVQVVELQNVSCMAEFATPPGVTTGMSFSLPSEARDT